jgi:hypothetical protein
MLGLQHMNKIQSWDSRNRTLFFAVKLSQAQGNASFSLLEPEPHRTVYFFFMNLLIQKDSESEPNNFNFQEPEPHDFDAALAKLILLSQSGNRKLLYVQYNKQCKKINQQTPIEVSCSRHSAISYCKQYENINLPNPITVSILL